MTNSRTEAVTNAALALGFCRVGFSPIEPMRRGAQALHQWLQNGHHGEMAYMAQYKRHDPRLLLENAKSLIVVALAYDRKASDAESDPSLARIARYARGRDYHEVLKEKLYRLADQCSKIVGRPVLARPCVDTAPLLEREAAQYAGVGFIAKSTLAIVPGVGSYVLLGELLTDLDLIATPAAKPRCGTCTACISACPTGAFVSPYVLDARRCISYLTIELKGSIPLELRPLLGNHVFGCDICQQVCPFNKGKTTTFAPEFKSRPEVHLSLVELLTIGSSRYRKLVQHSAMRRTHRAQLMRNAAVALGNTRDRSYLPVLEKALAENPYPLVREHIAWAISQINSTSTGA
jgi:epoxyqueuosine reductase